MLEFLNEERNGFMTYKEQCRGQISNFFIITELPSHLHIHNFNRVHPLKQKMTIQIIEELSNKNLLNKIETIILFGSSITKACGMKSDLDIAFKLLPHDDELKTKNIVYDIVGECSDWNFDLFFLDRINPDGRFYKNIMNGVILYHE